MTLMLLLLLQPITCVNVGAVEEEHTVTSVVEEPKVESTGDGTERGEGEVRHM